MKKHDLVHSHGKQQEIAHGCAITVVTEPHLAAHPGLIARSLRRTFPTACAVPVSATRYDLLAVPNLDELIGDGVRFELLVEDVLTALSLHQTEYLAVISEEGTQARLVEKLAGETKLSGVNLRGRSVPSRKTAPGGLLALTCMDWRLHGAGLIEHLRQAFGRRPGGIMTVPGAGKDVCAATVRGRVVAAVMFDLVGSGFNRVAIVSHTDCGKYGGHGAFAGADDENERLTGDLRQAAAFLRTHLDVEVSLGIAEIADARIVSVTDLAAAGRLCHSAF